MFSAIRYRVATDHQPFVLDLLDQRQLPLTETWINCSDLESAAKAIEDMVIRGAPAIGCAAAFGLAIDAVNFMQSNAHKLWADYKIQFHQSIQRLARTRPTAVNLFYALDAMEKLSIEWSAAKTISEVAFEIQQLAVKLFDDDIRTCKAIGEHGKQLLDHPGFVLTHCNTGSLATAGYGTALGIIRSLHQSGNIKQVWVDETRPYLQGSRLTAYELGQDQIPYRLIADNMAGYLMSKGQVNLVVVGADRIARNGDTANKIGTYSLAVLCAYHKIPFVVAAPRTTIDTSMTSGARIPVEERPPHELREVQGISIAPLNALVWNPSFDVTPAHLITAIVTESGITRGPHYQFT